ncbi:MAG: hypothetical protein PHE51_12095 [Eubacteriales bacterium]|nr:hypothetical protein [Eubacteriales bacterium]
MKKYLVLMLALVMTLCLIPATAWSAEDTVNIGDNTITSYNDLTQKLSGVSDISKDGSTIIIKLTKNIIGRINFEINDAHIIFDANNKTISGGDTNEPICLENFNNLTVELIGNGIYTSGFNNTIFVGVNNNLIIKSATIKGAIYHDDSVKITLQKGYNYYTAKNDGTDIFDSEQITGEQLLPYKSIYNLVVKQHKNDYFTMSYNSNGGSGTMADSTITVGTSFILPECAFTPPEGMQFKCWKIGSDTTWEEPAGMPITFSDKQFDGQSIKAVWESKPEYNITVTKGTANPAKSADGTVDTLTADASPSGMVFDKWEVTGATVDDINRCSTTFIMTEGNVTATATYIIVHHTHIFDQEIAKAEALKDPASCTTDEVYFKSCSCGAISTMETFFKANTAMGHDYTEKLTDDAHLKSTATKYQQHNTYWYDCSRCAANAKDDKSATDKWYEDTTEGSNQVSEGMPNDTSNPSNPSNLSNSTKQAEATTNTDPSGIPKTGDNSNMFLWTTLLFLSGFGLVGITLFAKRR